MIPDVNPSEGKPPEAEPPDAEPTDPLDHFLQRRRRQLQIATAVVLVLLPVLIHVVYRSVTSLPSRVTLATGPEGGATSSSCCNWAGNLNNAGSR
ncbi:MAG: hypothetical protein Ct9H300mP1_11670 [Planctomycetaceae bacterium]|nr:MAG: hypothetical protein Ct9H300mP1_11670 [Planctomycetaceae bacterium]